LGTATPFRDKRLRQAFSLSIDRDLWINTFYEVDKFKAEGIPMKTPWNTVLTTNWPGWWLDPQAKELGPNAKNYKHDLAEAKKLVSAAGWNTGTTIKAQYPLTGYSADYLKHTEVMMGFANEVGLKMVTTPVNFNTDWRPKIATAMGDFEGISFRPDATGGLPHPVEFMYAGFHHEAGGDYTGFFSSDSSFQKGDPRLDDILSKARREFDVKKQQAGIQEMQRIVADEMYIVRMPGSSNSFTMSWPIVRNQQVWDGDTTLRNMWLDDTQKPVGKA
jgi:ABC-type transport system substrate-binding protein